MRRRKLLWQLYPTHLLITVLALLAVTWYGSKAVRGFYLDQMAQSLEARALLVESQIKPLLAAGDIEAVHGLCRAIGRKGATRLTVVAPDGKVLGDSEEDPARMDNHNDRPEVMAALQGRIEPAIRFSYTLGKRMMYVAIPLADGPDIAGVLRAAIPVTAIDAALQEIQGKIAVGALVAALLVALANWYIARRISRPLEHMKKGAERFAEGKFQRKLAVAGTEEVAGLALAMNRMARQLDDRLRTVLRQRNELEAVFSSMVEGVLTVDQAGRFLSINQAGAALLGVDPEAIQGKDVLEVVRNSDLQKFVRQSLSAATPVEREIVLNDAKGRERFFQAHGAVLRDAGGQNSGALIVIHDVTNLRRLENVRRDFVANVSHELKTPITAIKGFVETLLDGALDDKENAGKFLDIVLDKTDHLAAIIEDLLALSRLEQATDRQHIALAPNPLKKALQAAVQILSGQAAEKNITINLECPDDLMVNSNPALLEQAIVNLVGNAVKYSPAGSAVVLDASQSSGETVIHVRDSGPGIAGEDLPRLFERFYRADKARSNAVGGTGLGLSIVKHIVQAHGGRVEVASTPGKGSIFTIRLPLRPAAAA